MSIQSWCERDTVAILRETVADDGSEYATKTWTTGARGSSLPTSVSCRAQDVLPEEATMLGVTSANRAYKLYFSDDPYIDSQDHVVVTDTGGVERECFVLHPSFSFDGAQARLWKAIVVEYGATLE